MSHTIITRNPGLQIEIEARLMAGNRCDAAPNGMLRKGGMSSQLKIKDI